jgi:hypothetical protein
VNTVLGWLGRIFHPVVVVADDVKRLAERAVTYLWSVLETAFIVVRGAWLDMVRGAEAIASLLADFGHDVYVVAKWIIDKAIPDVVKWAEREIRSVEKGIEVTAHDIESWAERSIKSVEHDIDRYETWIERYIWLPLRNGMKSVEKWIDKEGRLIWAYIDHPERLAKLLLRPMWREFLIFVHGSETIIGQWLLAGIYTAMVDTADIIESILSDML